MLGDQRREIGESFRDIGGLLQRISDAHCAQGKQFDALAAQFSDFSRSSQERLVLLEKQAAETSKALRGEVVSTLTDIAEAVTMNMKSVGEAQKIQLYALGAQFTAAAKITSDKLDAVALESASHAKGLQEEVVGTLTKTSESMHMTLKTSRRPRRSSSTRSRPSWPN